MASEAMRAKLSTASRPVLEAVGSAVGGGVGNEDARRVAP